MKEQQTKISSKDMFHLGLFYKRKLCLFFLLLIPMIGFAQQLHMKGSVLDQQGQPLIGVSVSVKGTSVGTATDMDGHFSINAPSDAVLQFTYLGMQSQEIPVAGKSTLTVTMQDTYQDLDEVVVVGYGTMKKKDLTTAVSSVSSKEWEDRPIISAAQGLQGKAAGVQVTVPSGKPGVGLSVRVRGNTSINAGNDPLYVVDGIPTSDISNLSPNDIEGMQILKDASSAAIYGARAANGVVLITTKKGTAGSAKVSLSAYGGFSNVSKTIDALKTNDYYDLVEEIYGKGYVDRTNQNYTNWNDEIYKTGYQQNYQLAISGGNEISNYYVSGGYQNETGVISPAEYERFSIRSNVNTSVKKWLKMSTNLSFARTDRIDATDNQNSTRGGIILSVLNTPPFLDIWDKTNPNQYATNPFNPSWENPVAQSQTYDNNLDYRFMGNFSLDFTILEGLHFKPSFAADYTSHRWDKFIDGVKTGYGRQKNGEGQYSADQYLTWIGEGIMTYDKSFDQVHNLSLLGGVTFEDYSHDNGYISGSDFIKGVTEWDVMTLNMANKIDNAYSSKDAYSLLSTVARAHYNYKSKYLVTANFRADGSSKLHPNHRWGYFPSASLGWRFSDESFFSPLTNIINDGKLRAGWGINGNQNGIGNYDYFDRYSVVRTETTGNGPNIKYSGMANEDLTWETTTQYNLGLDLSFFNSRIALALDAYYKETKDLLLIINLPEAAGKPNPMRNGGEMLNKGIEFDLTTYNLTGAFKWDTEFNMSFNKNELTKMDLTPQYTAGSIEGRDNAILIKPGLPLGSFYGYVAEGVDPETGDIIYTDVNKNGYVDAEDRTVIGNAQPDFIFGMTNNMSWQNFVLSFFIQGTYGNDIFNASRIETEGLFDTRNQTTVALDRWMRPGMITDIPRAGNSANSKTSSRFVEDGSYIRLKSLTLSYNFKRDWIKRLGMENLSIYATGNNLITLTKYRGYDPEVNTATYNTRETNNDRKRENASTMGMDYGTFPQTRSFIFGLNVTF